MTVRRLCALLLMITSCLISVTAFAQSSNATPARTITPPDASQDGENESSSSSLGGRSMGTTVAALGAILLLFLGLVQVWRKYAPQVNQSLPASAWQILGTAPLDQKHQLTIVRVGSRLLVLGQSDQGLQTLTEITNGEEVAQLMAMCQTQKESSDSALFGDLLNKFRLRGESFPVSSPEEAKRA